MLLAGILSDKSRRALPRGFCYIQAEQWCSVLFPNILFANRMSYWLFFAVQPIEILAAIPADFFHK